ncbi:LysM peptidoglycan-binding domain-containing protein [Tessaracoccus sp. HDW20]|uniref:LysM peptidoglycan-binding domain-containing protein n=1 Tax=Tessaracoccus coleopterorum TaxID=2714950 RepID=UPI0018D431BE|nr:LysM peptidoglycan-binding domain-containing protein [Tessaracoccus coleopterorum]NHB86166.1 LysM peptidoglycan-binding domain-containing protein [Tessaracoccus coleopterorum]
MNFTRRIMGILALLLLAGLLAGVPLVLWWVTQPFLPTTMPTPDQIIGAFTARDDGTLIAVVLIVVGWLSWAYLAVALVVEIVAAIRRVPAPQMPGFRLPQGAAKGLVSAAMLAFIAVPAIAGTANADDAPHPAPATITAPSATETTAAESTVSHATTIHVVGPKDSLYSLAATYLGDGDRWPEIFNDNKGIVQANGARLTDPDLIVDGTALTITTDSPAVPQPVTRPTKTTTHTVGPGDTLYRLAETHLGSGDRYMEIFNDNKGIVQANGARLTDPDLIVDGTVLTITLDPNSVEITPHQPRPAPPKSLPQW